MQQILQWLFKAAHDQARDTTPSNKEIANGQEAKSKEIINLVKNRSWCTRKHNKIKDQGRNCGVGCKNFKVFSFLCRRNVAKACFYSTLNLRRVNSFSNSNNTSRKQQQQQKMMMIQSMKMKKLEEQQKVVDSSATQAGNKVLPVTDTPLSSSNDQTESVKVKGDKTKAMSRMKEMLRWVAAAKSDKGKKFLIGRKVMHLRNRGSLKGAVTGDDDQLSFESPKISFRWEVESSYSTTTCSGISMASSSSKNDISLGSTPIHDINPSRADRKGNWITTDSEFVVLEL